jgi:phage terminase large subunit GpA-like protein
MAASEFDMRSELLGRFADMIRVPALTSPEEWAADNREYADVAGIPGPRDPYLSPSLVPLGQAVVSGKYTRVVGVTAAQMGKALGLDTPIPTPEGWVRMGDIQIGDLVFGSDGSPVEVVAVSEIFEGHGCFAVTFDDGESIIADAGHQWSVSAVDGSGRNRRDETLTTTEMIERGVRSSRGRSRFAIPVAAPLVCADADLPIDPYVLGVWLGDGNSRAAAVTVGREDLDVMVDALSDCGLDCTVSADKNCWRVALSIRNASRKDGLRPRLRALGVLSNKHVPAAYLRASESQRRALLAGLMDTDGSAEAAALAGFCSASRVLADGVFEIAASLGFKPRLSQHAAGHWIVRFSCYQEDSVFRLARKNGALRSRHDPRARPNTATRRTIASIDPVPSEPVVCISVAAEDSLFLAGRGMVPTHNTDTELDVIGQRLDQRPTPILYVGPSADFNRDQFEPRLKQMIDECEGLKDKLVRGRREKKTLKIVAGVKVRLASGGSSTALKSDPAGLAVVDEYDEMSSNIRGQGDPLGLIEARGETYSDFVTVVTSTPGKGVVETEEHVVAVDDDGEEIKMEFFAVGDPTEIESPIWRLFQEGTRHHWAWDCPCCGVPFIPMRKHLKWVPGSSPAQAARTAYLECPNNGCIIEDDSHQHEDYKDTIRAKMNATGFMIAPGQTIEDAKADRNQPDNSTYSQWSSGLCSPFVSWGTRAERLVKAEMSGEEDKRQTAMNANFGEVYSPGVSGDLPDWQALLKHRGDFGPGSIHRGMVRIAMGVDVQKRGLYFVIRGFGARGTSWLIQHGYLIGPTDEDEVWNDLANIMLSPISGVHIEKVFIDSGFRPDKAEAGSVHRVYDFCRQYSFLCSPCKGRSTTGGRPYSVSKIEVKPDGSRRPFSVNLLMLDTDFFKSLVHTRIKTPIGAPGAFYLHSEADESYARQVLSEVRVVSPGKLKAVWKRVRRDNHFLDCEALVAAAGYSLNVQAIPEGVEREWGEDDSTPETEEQEEAQPETDPPSEPSAKVDLRNRFRRLGPGRLR